MKITLSLPSLYPMLLDRALSRIYETTDGFDVEIVVVAPFPVARPRVKWVHEAVPQGNCAAHALAYENATGDVVVTLSDDLLPEGGWLGAVLDHLRRGERRSPLFASGLHYYTDRVGTVFGIYYPYLPVLSRATIESVGGYFSREFHARFGDVDLGLRVWRAGGRCEPCLQAIYRPLEDRDQHPESPHKAASQAHDVAVFLAKWQKIYGTGWPTDSIRDYNIDVFSHALPYVMSDNTVFLNDPSFGRIIYDHYRRLNLSYGSKV